MVNAVHFRLNAADRSYFAILKKEVRALAVAAQFGVRRLGEIDIIVAEMVTNLAKHAGGGELFVKLIEEKGLQGIEIISIDSGPGIADLRAMMQDGATTKNTLGQGLGAIKRLSHLFQVYTQKGWGTILLCRVFTKEPPVAKAQDGIEIRSFVVPKPGEEECGDGFSSKITKDHIRLFLGDGLGHGKEAAIAVQKAIEAFQLCSETSPVEVLRAIHLSVKRTRGLVGTVAIFHRSVQKWTICGVGNISTRFWGPTISKSHNPYNGIIGLNMPNSLHDQEVGYEKGQSIVLCSDGIKSKWDALRFPGIVRHDLSLLTASIFKEYARNTDDMSVAGCKLTI